MSSNTNKKVYLIYGVEIIILSILFYITSNKLGVFEDEYFALAANSSFFNSLDFNGGVKAGGSYSVALTSGPISSIGGVVGWFFSKNLVVARFSNFIWSLILNVALVTYVKKYLKFNLGFF